MMSTDQPPPTFRVRATHRLPMDAYGSDGSTWHVTIGAADRSQRPFEQPALAIAIIELLRQRSAPPSRSLHTYCLMPDHLHFILSLTDTNLVSLVSEFKSTTTREWWKHVGTGRLWQPSFHDRGIRNESDFDQISQYILKNPVRTGLVEEWMDYPYSGGELVE